ncbi:MAG: hypothetical protein WCI19_10205 [Betaproteobacteria bacterium]
MSTLAAPSPLPPPMSRLKSRLVLLSICALLLLPVLSGGSLYLSGWRPARSINHGALIEPPLPLAGDPAWRGKWSLTLVSDAPCGSPCAARLDELRRVRVALARDMGRTRYVWVGTGVDAEARQLAATAPDLRTIAGRPPALAGFAAGSIVIVDPHGLAMMAYAPQAPINGIRSDLERLLKLSWIE